MEVGGWIGEMCSEDVARVVVAEAFSLFELFLRFVGALQPNGASRGGGCGDRSHSVLSAMSAGIC
jgi:hypothetical protein